MKEVPHNTITLINSPTTGTTGQNMAFTWDINGPAATTGYTTIVGGKESKPGTLDGYTDLAKTPYAVSINDFTNGSYNVPLRFIGNTTPKEAGVYYFRGVAFINDRYVWSDEATITVQ